MKQDATFASEDYKAIHNGLINVLGELEHFKKIEFNFNYSVNGGEVLIDREEIPDIIRNQAGVYIIETSNKGFIELLNTTWDDFKEEIKTVPMRNKGNLGSGCIYVGKNETNLKNRLTQHLDSVNSTYALNLRKFHSFCNEEGLEHTVSVTCYYYTKTSKKASRDIKMLIRATEGYFYEERSPLLGSGK